MFMLAEALISWQRQHKKGARKMTELWREEIRVENGAFIHHTVSMPKGELDHFVILPEENRGYFYGVGSLIITEHIDSNHPSFTVYPPGKWSKLQYREYDANKEDEDA